MPNPSKTHRGRRKRVNEPAYTVGIGTPFCGTHRSRFADFRTPIRPRWIRDDALQPRLVKR